jgi:hypothetical protein
MSTTHDEMSSPNMEEICQSLEPVSRCKLKHPM